jgi:hypothetical protein
MKTKVSAGMTVLEPTIAEGDGRYVKTVVLLVCFFPEDHVAGGRKLESGEYQSHCERLHCAQFSLCRGF